MAGQTWTAEETQAVLTLYDRLPFGQFHQGNPEVSALVAKLGKSPSAIAMKLSNFASLDPTITDSGRKGLEGTTKLDRRIWAERPKLRQVALASPQALPSGRVWITSFWGFNPEIDGDYGGDYGASNRDYGARITVPVTELGITVQ